MASEDHSADQPLTHRELMIGEFRDARRRRATESAPQPPLSPSDKSEPVSEPAEITGSKPAGSSDKGDLSRLDTDKG